MGQRPRGPGASRCEQTRKYAVTAAASGDGKQCEAENGKEEIMRMQKARREKREAEEVRICSMLAPVYFMRATAQARVSLRAVLMLSPFPCILLF